MKITDFYKEKIKKIEDDILIAETNKDYKNIAKLQAEKSKWEKRLNE